MRLAEEIDSDNLMRIYNHSSIKFTSLRQAFKAGEQERAEKLCITPELQAKVEFLADEIKLIGDYIKSLNVDEPVNLRPLDETIRVSGDERKFSPRPGVFFPISLEGRKILIDELQIKDRSLFETITRTNDLVKEYFSGFRHCITSSLERLHLMISQVGAMIEFDKEDLRHIAELSERYQIGQAPIAAQSGPNASGTPSAPKAGLSIASGRRFYNKKTVIQKGVTKIGDGKAARALTAPAMDPKSAINGARPGPSEELLSDVSEFAAEEVYSDPRSASSSGGSARASGVTRNLIDGGLRPTRSLSRSQRLIQSDFIRLFNVFSGAEDRLQIAEKYRRRAVASRKFASVAGGAALQQRFRGLKSDVNSDRMMTEKASIVNKLTGQGTLRNISAAADEVDDSVQLDDFDPIYRRKDAGVVRAGAMHMLGMDSQPRRLTIGAGQAGGTMTAKDRMKYKMLAQKALASIQRVQDDDTVEFEREADAEARRQKAAAAALRRKEHNMLHHKALSCTASSPCSSVERDDSSSGADDVDVAGSVNDKRKKRKRKEVRLFNQEHFDEMIREHNVKKE